MTTSQAMRYERRRQRAERERQELQDALLAILFGLLILAAFAIAGTMDYQDEQRQATYWANRGVTIQRGW